MKLWFILLCLMSIITSIILNFTINDMLLINYKNSINEENNKITETFGELIQLFTRYVYIGELFMVVYNYNESSWGNFINFTGFSYSPYNKYLNEMRLHYNISDNERQNYEEYMKNQTNNKNFNISYIKNPETDSSLTRLYKKDFYLPITYLSPNTTLSMVPYIGEDIHSAKSYNNIFRLLNNTIDNNTVIYTSRYIQFLNVYTLDISKKNDRGFVLVSIIVDDLLKLLFNNIKQFNTNIYYKVKILDDVFKSFKQNEEIKEFIETEKDINIKLKNYEIDVKLFIYENNFTTNLLEYIITGLVVYIDTGNDI